MFQGTLLNTFIVGPLLYAISIGGLMGMISLTLTDTIVFAALISAVDPVAVLAIFQEVGVNKDLYYLLFGESLLNGTQDGFTVVNNSVDGRLLFQMLLRLFCIQQQLHSLRCLKSMEYNTG